MRFFYNREKEIERLKIYSSQLEQLYLKCSLELEKLRKDYNESRKKALWVVEQLVPSKWSDSLSIDKCLDIVFNYAKDKIRSNGIRVQELHRLKEIMLGDCIDTKDMGLIKKGLVRYLIFSKLSGDVRNFKVLFPSSLGLKIFEEEFGLWTSYQYKYLKNIGEAMSNEDLIKETNKRIRPKEGLCIKCEDLSNDLKHIFKILSEYKELLIVVPSSTAKKMMMQRIALYSWEWRRKLKLYLNSVNELPNLTRYIVL